MTAKFSTAELAYLQGERRLGRLATAEASGRPQVTPVGMWSDNHELGSIDISGRDFATTRTYRNVLANPRRRSWSTTWRRSTRGGPARSWSRDRRRLSRAKRRSIR